MLASLVLLAVLLPWPLAAADLTSISIAVGLVGAVLAAAKAAMSFGPDRSDRFADLMERTLKASQGNADIWEERALSAEELVKTLRAEIVLLEQRIASLAGDAP